MKKISKQVLLLGIYPAIGIITVVLWYVLLYAPKVNERKAIEVRMQSVQKETESIKAQSVQLALRLKEKEQITECYQKLITELPRKEDIPATMVKIIKIGRGKNVRIVSMKPDTSELFSDSRAARLKSLKLAFVLEGRFIDIGRYLEEISDLPFFRGYENIRIEADKEIYPKTKANVVCTLLFL